MTKNCYDCKNCAYKPQEYGMIGYCTSSKNYFDGLPLEPLNASYAEHEEALGGFPSFAERCPDFELGERQKLCKELLDKMLEIAGKMEEWDIMLEGIQDFDFEHQDQFGKTVSRIFENEDPIDSSIIKASEGRDRVWKAMKKVGFTTRGTH